jgi:hypothetical protein
MKAVVSFVFALVLSSAACANAEQPPQYQLVARSTFGEAFVTQRSTGSLTKTLELTLADAKNYFGVAPRVHKAYEDAKDPRSGGASFALTVNGIALKGLITVKGNKVAVVFARADAPASEWSRLMAGNGDPAPKASAAVPATNELQTLHFPDGTGSIGLAKGWTTNAQSAMHALVVKGPADQEFALGITASVVTPYSTLPRMPTTLIAPYGTPAEVFAAIVPQIARINAQQGIPARSIDHLVKLKDETPTLPRGLCSVLRFGVTDTYPNGATRHYQAITRFEVDPISDQAFMISAASARGPDATFERDFPLMLSMMQSLRFNEAVVNQKNQQALLAQQQSFEAGQRAHKEQMAAYDAQNRAWQARQDDNDARNRNWQDRQNAVARRNDDFDEVIRGYRTVEDTRTGEKSSVNLGNVDKIVDDLNERDPGRYRQIPLKDELHPN